MTAVVVPDAVWTPRGRPVRNFVLSCLAIVVMAGALHWTGAVNPRLNEGIVNGQTNRDTDTYTYTVLVENEGPLAVEIVGFIGDHIDVDPGFQPVTVGGGDSVEVSVSGHIRCGRHRVSDGTVGPDLSLAMQVRPSIGPVRTHSGVFAGFLQEVCQDEESLAVSPDPPPTPHQPNGNPEG
jgi:hypothetical protein